MKSKLFSSIKVKKPKRRIVSAFIHCSDSDNPKHNEVEVIKKWHLDRGFNDVGYHYFIKSDGEIQEGRDIELIPAAQYRYNNFSIAICLHGKDKFSQKQFESLRKLCLELQRDQGHQLRFRGHCEVANKTCPNFDYVSVLNLDEHNHMKRTRVVAEEMYISQLMRLDPNRVIVEIY